MFIISKYQQTKFSNIMAEDAAGALREMNMNDTLLHRMVNMLTDVDMMTRNMKTANLTDSGQNQSHPGQPQLFIADNNTTFAQVVRGETLYIK